jgi:hypothetical protein
MPDILDPQTPVCADHRFIRALLNSILAGKVLHVPKEYERVSKVFKLDGGSWQRLFSGSIEDISKLKKVVKFAYENGYLTKKEPWAQSERKEPSR